MNPTKEELAAAREMWAELKTGDQEQFIQELVAHLVITRCFLSVSQQELANWKALAKSLGFIIALSLIAGAMGTWLRGVR